MDISFKNLEKLIVVGDRVLIKPKSLNDRTKYGLYLPPTVIEKEEIQSGYNKIGTRLSYSFFGR